MKTKPDSKAVVKVADKKSPQPAPKAAQKPAAKPLTKAAPKKPAVKAAKPVAKAAPKKPVTGPAKASAEPKKPTAGSSAKAQSAPVKKPAGAQALATARPDKAAAPNPVKASAKTAAKAEAAPAPSVKPVKKENPPLSKSITAADTKVAPVETEKTAVSSSGPTYSAVPARSGRVSSRLAQLTVPSMAATPAVASTAAKASYGHTTESALPTPPHFVPVKKDSKLANNWATKPVAQWTDEEVVAMPDSEYMNEGQMAFFRLKLTQLKRDILASAGETTEHLREETVVVPDPADRATIEEEHALELRTRDRERKLLKKIEQSIARIDAGDYGYCDETGEAIGVSRLLARPTATLSLEAQQRRELKQKMFGD